MNKNNINTLKNGGIGVIPTDTLYGLVGQALNVKTVERIYQVRKRKPTKPFIVLISKITDLEKFAIKLDKKTEEILNNIWPGQVSVILPCQNKALKYLHRGLNSIAFRLPAKKDLINLIKETGPLVAPSANSEDQAPALTIDEAKKYFGHKIDFYQDVGRLESAPSTLIKLVGNKIEILRPGAVKISI